MQVGLGPRRGGLGVGGAEDRTHPLAGASVRQLAAAVAAEALGADLARLPAQMRSGAEAGLRRAVDGACRRAPRRRCPVRSSPGSATRARAAARRAARVRADDLAGIEEVARIEDAPSARGRPGRAGPYCRATHGVRARPVPCCVLMVPPSSSTRL